MFFNLGIHWLILLCAMTEGPSGSLGVSRGLPNRGRSNQLSFQSGLKHTSIRPHHLVKLTGLSVFPTHPRTLLNYQKQEKRRSLLGYKMVAF